MQSRAIHHSKGTVKASNFGPDRNFGPLLSEGLAIIETSPAEKVKRKKL
jgi:hypothetical protein